MPILYGLVFKPFLWRVAISSFISILYGLVFKPFLGRVIVFISICICSDPNNESDPSSEYSLLGLTHVMNHCLGQKFIRWVKINCLDMSLKPGTGIPRPRTVSEWMNHFIFCKNATHTDGIPCIQNG